MEDSDDSPNITGCEPGQDPLVGSVFDGRYQLLSLLGRGGSSSVYKALHLDVDRLVALKILHTHLQSSADSLQRFQREARAVAILDHPNIVKIYSFGVSQDGQPYICGEFLQGHVLKELICEQGRLAPCSCLPIFEQICRALAHAHEHGIVHRDVKPGNIVILAADDAAKTVKVVDFGIARLLSDRGTPEQKLTQTGVPFGSPAYMSPEQCLGQAVDERSDIYSLGVLMFETLTGSLPFQGTNELDLMSRQCSQPPPRLGTAAPGLVLPPSLEAAVYQCLEKDPSKRFQSMQTMSEALALAAEQESSPADRSLPDDAPPQKTIARKKSFLAPVIFLFVLLLSIVGALQYKCSHENALAQLRQNAGRDYHRHDLKAAIAEARQALALRRAEFWRSDGKSLYTDIQELSCMQLKQRLFQESIPLLEEMVALAKSGNYDLSKEKMAALLSLSFALDQSGRSKEAQPVAARAVAAARAEFGQASHEDFASQLNYGKLLMKLQPSQAQPMLETASDGLMKLGKELEETGEKLAKEAQRLAAMDKFRQALLYYNQARDAAESLGEAGTPRLAQALQALGHCHTNMGENDAGEQWMRRAVTALKRVYGNKDHQIWEAQSALATVLCQQKKFAQAEEVLKPELMLISQVRGPDSLDALFPLDTLIWSFWGQDKLKEEADFQIQGLRIVDKHLSPSHPWYKQQVDSAVKFFGLLPQDETAGQILKRLAKTHAGKK